MGFEITKGAVFYIFVMLLVIYIGISIVTGMKPWELVKALGEAFEPGKVFVRNEPGIIYDCGTPDVLTLVGPKFSYSPKANEKSVEFAIALDYMNDLFLGLDTRSNNPEIACKMPEDSKEMQCPQDEDYKFMLTGVSVPRKNTVFHFTVWKANPLVIDALTSGETLSTMLDTYAGSYISSFDRVKDVNKECERPRCENLLEPDCKGTEGCYWRAPLPFFSSCKSCEPENNKDPTNCRSYDTDACTQCNMPKSLRCKVGWGPTLTLGECQPGD